MPVCVDESVLICVPVDDAVTVTKALTVDALGVLTDVVLKVASAELLEVAVAALLGVPN